MGSAYSVPVVLPQNDDEIQTRQRNLESARKKYQLQQSTFGLTDIEQRLVNIVNLPPMLREFPKEEKRSFFYMFFLGVGVFFSLIYIRIFGRGKWTIPQMIRHFRNSKVLKEPKGCEVWRNEEIDGPNQTHSQRAQADHWFAWQRLNGVTRNLIKRVKAIPEQFVPFVDIIEENHPYLTEMTLEKHIQQGTLYVVDLTEISLNEPTLLSTMALFGIYKDSLMPVALWMNNTDAKEGKVYTPRVHGDPSDIRQWVKMRMWFNMLESQYHQSVTHTGFTHLLMEGVSVCMHRNLSDRHPIYKILIPHFHYMHGKNTNENWAYSTHASTVTSLETREAMTIPGYFFKDDALRLHGAIRQYVSEYAKHYYNNSDENVQQDPEIQAFREELILPRAMDGTGGCGINGIPEFTSIQNLVDVVTNFIFTCSVEHSAASFSQYDQYVFPPNMPSILHGHPEEETDDLDAAMPTGKELFYVVGGIQLMTQILTNTFGNYEARYMKAMDSDGKAFVKRFQQHLAVIAQEINQRNADITACNNEREIKEYPYEWLLPEKMLNSICA